MEGKQLEWYVHILRMEDDKLPKNILETETIRGQRREPRRTWLQCIEEIGASRGKSVGKMNRQTRNKEKWKNWIKQTSIQNPMP